MRPIVLPLFLALSLSFSAIGKEKVKIDYDDVYKIVIKENLSVKENAQKVYIAKEKVSYARQSLLPKLNIWTLFKIPAAIVDWFVIPEILRDVFPFLIPSNWFKVKQEKANFEIENLQFNSMAKNQILNTKSILLNYYKDSETLNTLLAIKKEITLFNKWIEGKYKLGLLNYSSYLKYRDYGKQIDQDIQTINQIIEIEKSQLKYNLSINQNTEVEIRDLNFKELKSVDEAYLDNFIFHAKVSSNELKQFKKLIESIKHIKNSAYFNVLGTSEGTSGLEGYTDIPIDNGLGVNIGKTIKLSKENEVLFKTQMLNLERFIEKQTVQYIKSINMSKHTYVSISKRLDDALEVFSLLKKEIGFGLKVEESDYLVAIANILNLKINSILEKYNLIESQELLTRILLNNEYSKEINFEKIIKEEKKEVK